MGELIIIPRGGFGNILFNILFIHSMGKKYNMKYKFTNTVGHRKSMEKYSMFKDFEYTNNTNNCIYIKENSFLFQDINLDCEKKYLFDGYFQSYKYSEVYLQEIKSMLYETYLKYNKIHKIDENENTILLHVRRGDYVGLQDIHPVQNDDYYQDSLDKIYIKNSKILVFSDDINYVKNWNLLKNYNYEIVDIEDPEECFWKMTTCNHFIIANSSFSLLSYYFRDNIDAKLCIPKKWFGSSGPKFLIEDLIKINDNVYII